MSGFSSPLSSSSHHCALFIPQEPALEHIELRGNIASVEEFDEEGRMPNSFRIVWHDRHRSPLVAFTDTEDDAEVLNVGLRTLASL